MTLLLKSGWFRGVQALSDVFVSAQLDEDLGASGILATDLNGTTFKKKFMLLIPDILEWIMSFLST